ncbi:hypothetical protein B6N60_03901 [Richelia sinica FACHB-800]|uniref:Uncharacterized protein n=1 Tax=Richelia sinica FACHB-800 TaxID=1357546 RepID=A0A975TAN3_9NOST|nr:hypothetical protein B6N60_03901 [Richelia sinica FACHB-800]
MAWTKSNISKLDNSVFTTIALDYSVKKSLVVAIFLQ